MVKQTLVKIVIGCLLILGFSGCATKAVFYKEQCSIEKPIRTQKAIVCGSLESYSERMYCLIGKYNTLESDYNLLEAYAEECIK